MTEPRPAVAAELTWAGELRFRAAVKGRELVVDGDGAAGFSPVQALAIALAGCMSADIVHILTKARQPLRALRARFHGARAPENPRRFLRIELHFELQGEIASEKVERAIALSRETYCSVWHSMRPDIEFVTSFAVTA